MDSEPVKIDMSKEPIPPALLMKVSLVVPVTKYNISLNSVQGNDKEISRDEETTVILQLDILRGIHSDLHNVGQVLQISDLRIHSLEHSQGNQSTPGIPDVGKSGDQCCDCYHVWILHNHRGIGQ